MVQICGVSNIRLHQCLARLMEPVVWIAILVLFFSCACAVAQQSGQQYPDRHLVDAEIITGDDGDAYLRIQFNQTYYPDIASGGIVGIKEAIFDEQNTNLHMRSLVFKIKKGSIRGVFPTKDYIYADLNGKKGLFKTIKWRTDETSQKPSLLELQLPQYIWPKVRGFRRKTDGEWVKFLFPLEYKVEKYWSSDQPRPVAPLVTASRLTEGSEQTLEIKIRHEYYPDIHHDGFIGVLGTQCIANTNENSIGCQIRADQNSQTTIRNTLQDQLYFKRVWYTQRSNSTLSAELSSLMLQLKKEWKLKRQLPSHDSGFKNYWIYQFALEPAPETRSNLQGHNQSASKLKTVLIFKDFGEPVSPTQLLGLVADKHLCEIPRDSISESGVQLQCNKIPDIKSFDESKRGEFIFEPPFDRLFKYDSYYQDNDEKTQTIMFIGRKVVFQPSTVSNEQYLLLQDPPINIIPGEARPLRDVVRFFLSDRLKRKKVRIADPENICYDLSHFETHSENQDWRLIKHVDCEDPESTIFLEDERWEIFKPELQLNPTDKKKVQSIAQMGKRLNRAWLLENLQEPWAQYYVVSFKDRQFTLKPKAVKLPGNVNKHILGRALFGTNYNPNTFNWIQNLANYKKNYVNLKKHGIEDIKIDFSIFDRVVLQLIPLSFRVHLVVHSDIDNHHRDMFSSSSAAPLPASKGTCSLLKPTNRRLPLSWRCSSQPQSRPMNWRNELRMVGFSLQHDSGNSFQATPKNKNIDFTLRFFQQPFGGARKPYALPPGPFRLLSTRVSRNATERYIVNLKQTFSFNNWMAERQKWLSQLSQLSRLPTVEVRLLTNLKGLHNSTFDFLVKDFNDRVLLIYYPLRSGNSYRSSFDLDKIKTASILIDQQFLEWLKKIQENRKPPFERVYIRFGDDLTVDARDLSEVRRHLFRLPAEYNNDPLYQFTSSQIMRNDYEGKIANSSSEVFIISFDNLRRISQFERQYIQLKDTYILVLNIISHNYFERVNNAFNQYFRESQHSQSKVKFELIDSNKIDSIFSLGVIRAHIEQTR